MAELLLKVGTVGVYEDGDIICAHNSRRISCCHVQTLCNPALQTVNRDGLLSTGTIAHDWFERTHKFRFERISTSEVRRTLIATGRSDVVSGTPNANGESMDVRQYIERRQKAARSGRPKKALFGTAGSEQWYGGQIDMSAAALALVWDDVEAKTANNSLGLCGSNSVDPATSTTIMADCDV